MNYLYVLDGSMKREINIKSITHRQGNVIGMLPLLQVNVGRKMQIQMTA